MPLKQIFFSFKGRVRRSTFWLSTFVLWIVFVALFVLTEAAIGRGATLLLYPFFFWSLFAILVKRYHDLGRSGWWLVLLLIPVIGVLWVFIELALRRGKPGQNRYGADPVTVGLDYLTVS